MQTLKQRSRDWLPARPRGVDRPYLHVDDSCARAPRRVGIGGFLRDSNRQWIAGFHGGIGITFIIQAELEAVFQGLGFWGFAACVASLIR